MSNVLGGKLGGNSGQRTQIPAQQRELVHLRFLPFRVDLLSKRTELVVEIPSLQVLQDKPR